MTRPFSRGKVVSRIKLHAKWIDDSRTEEETKNEIVVLKDFCEEVLREGLFLEG